MAAPRAKSTDHRRPPIGVLFGHGDRPSGMLQVILAAIPDDHSLPVLRLCAAA